MMSIIWEDSITDERVSAVANYFGVSKELAESAIEKGYKEIEEIKDYLESVGEVSSKVEQPRCLCCGKRLKDPVSIKRGYGEDCFKRVQRGLFSGLFEEFNKDAEPRAEEVSRR